MSGQPGETQVLLITCNNYHLLIPVGHIPAPHETSSEQSKSASDAGNTSQDTNAKKPNGLESVKSENGSYLVSPSYQNGTAALGVFNTSDQEDCVGKVCNFCFMTLNVIEYLNCWSSDCQIPCLYHIQHLLHGYLCIITFIRHKDDVIIIVRLLYRATTHRPIAL